MSVTLQDDEASAKACAASLLSLREAPVEEVRHLDSSALGTSQNPLPGEAVTAGTKGESVASPPPSPGHLSTDVEAAPRVSDGSLKSTDPIIQPPKAAEHMLNDAHTDGNCRPVLAREAINLTKDDDKLEVVSGDGPVESEGDSPIQDLAPEVIDLTQDGEGLEVVSDDCPVEFGGDSQHQDLASEVIDLTQDDDDLEEVLVPRKSLKRKRGQDVQIYRHPGRRGRSFNTEDVCVKVESDWDNSSGNTCLGIDDERLRD